MDVKLVGVVGCGLMGSGIAEVFARGGIDVAVYDVDQSAVDRGLGRIDASLQRAVDHGKLSEDDRGQARERISLSAVLESLSTVDLCIEDPPPLLLRMRDAGALGRKTGRGFYAYGD